MKNSADKIRLAVFKIWFVTLAVTIATFAVKFTTIQGIGPPFASIFQSLQMMTGLIIPQISVMVAFYFTLDKQGDKIKSLSESQISIIIWLSIGYHIIFILSLIGGVGFYCFDHTADGHSLQRNTAAVLAIMGLFSVMLSPVAFLFASPISHGRHSGPENSQGTNAGLSGS